MKNLTNVMYKLGWHKADHEDNVSVDDIMFRKGRSKVYAGTNGNQIALYNFLTLPEEVTNVWEVHRRMMSYLKSQIARGVSEVCWLGHMHDKLVVENDYTMDAGNEKDMLDALGEHHKVCRRISRKLRNVCNEVLIMQQKPSDQDDLIVVPSGPCKPGFKTMTECVDFYQEYYGELYNEDEDIPEWNTFDDNIALYTPRFREVLRKYGIEALIELFAKEDSRLDKPFMKNALRDMWERLGGLGENDIRLVDCLHDIEILGETYHGIGDFMSPDKKNHVKRVCEPYPCFDDYDVLYEDRFYQLYAFSKEDISADEAVDSKMRDIMRFVSWPNFAERVSFPYPLVYYRGDGSTCLLIIPRRKISSSK